MILPPDGLLTSFQDHRATHHMSPLKVIDTLQARTHQVLRHYRVTATRQYSQPLSPIAIVSPPQLAAISSENPSVPLCR